MRNATRKRWGNDTAASLFQQRFVLKMITTPWGYVETFALMQRKKNDKRISSRLFGQAVSRLRTDMIDLAQFRLLTVSDAAIIGSIIHIQRHNLNSTDAALLTTFLNYARITGEACALVAADDRFCRAARAEGLAAINPETMSAADVKAFLAAL